MSKVTFADMRTAIPEIRALSEYGAPVTAGVLSLMFNKECSQPVLTRFCDQYRIDLQPAAIAKPSLYKLIKSVVIDSN